MTGIEIDKKEGNVMKLGEALARVDGMKPNGYTAGGMTQFCN